MEIIIALIAFGILVIVHEGGHLLAARSCKVAIEKFSIGFGPKLASFTKNDTEYRISLIPLGGYLKMKGENPDEFSQEDDAFNQKKWWQKAYIAVSGPVANLILALIIFIIISLIGREYQSQLPIIGKVESGIEHFQKNDEILSINGKEVKGWNDIIENYKTDTTNKFTIFRNNEIMTIDNIDYELETWFEDILPLAKPVVGEVAPGLPAYRAGIKTDDKILAVNDTKVSSWYEMRDLIINAQKHEITLKIERDNKILTKTLETEKNVLTENRVIGITQKLPVKYKVKYNLPQSIQNGVFTTLNFVGLNYYGLYKIITNPASIKSNIGGPVMIYTISKETAKKGLTSILTLIASISIILMVMNLLPIPILDGGHIFFNFLEGILGRPVKASTQAFWQKIGLGILLFLMIFAFFNDFDKIFQRNRSIKQEQQQLEENK